VYTDTKNDCEILELVFKLFTVEWSPYSCTLQHSRNTVICHSLMISSKLLNHMFSVDISVNTVIHIFSLKTYMRHLNFCLTF